MKQRAAIIATVLLALAGPLGAQTPPDSVRADSTVYEVDALVVRVARPTVTAGGASAVEVRVDSLALPPAPTLDEVLRAMPLVQVRQNSRGEDQLMLRGANERQVAILVDGVPLTLGWDHRMDLSIVPMMAARSIRLMRGMPSILAGPNVLGGVVEVSVASGRNGRLPEPEPFRVNLGVDHLGARSLGAVGARRFEPASGTLLVRGGAGYRKSPGFALSSALASAGTDESLRINSDDEQVDGFLALRYRGEEGGWLSLAASGFQAERGVPPEMHEAEPRLWRYPSIGRAFAALSGGTAMLETPFGRGDVEASLGVSLGRTEIDEYATAAYDEITGGERGQDRTLTLRLLADHTLGENGELRAAATLADVSYDETLLPTLAERYENTYQQRLWSVGTEVAWRLDGLGALHGVRLSGGVALDGISTPQTGGHAERAPITALGGRFGVSALAGESLQLHVGTSRRARFPSLRELYSAALGKFEPNPGLGPETLTALEAGVTARLGAAEVQLVGFHHRLTDAIVREPSDVAKYRRVNRDEMRSTGVELLGSGAWHGIGFTGDLTLQRVRILDPEVPEAARQAEYNPTIAGGLGVVLPLPYELRGTAGLDYTGEQWCVVPGAGESGMSLEPTTRLDFGLSRLWGRLEAVLSLDNATDAAVYDQCGLPQPGRTLRLQFSFR